MLIPRGYKVVVKRWRSAHGGGLLILALEHLLCDPIKLEKYHKDESAEMIGMGYDGISYVDVYTNKSALCKHLMGALQQLKHDMPDNSFVFVGDFNAHNRDWILSESPTNEAGEFIEEFAQIQGLNQFVDFPTRMNNTLDLILSDADGSATASAPLGTNDHISIKFEVQVKHCVSEKCPIGSVLNWKHAPWHQVRRSVKTALKGWAPGPKQSSDAAEAEIDRLLWSVVEKHVKKRAPTRPRPCPWWTRHCQQAYNRKLQAFFKRREHPARYRNANRKCKRIQRKAFAEYNNSLSKTLKTMEKSDGKFWDLTKEISGLQTARSKAAPDAEVLVFHLASKMSNAANVHDNGWEAPDHWQGKAKLLSFKVHYATMLSCLKGLDSKKPINGIPNLLMKECAMELYVPLTKLYRHICRTGSFPQRWKIGRITALHKRGDISDPKMYRPVQVLLNDELVFEGVIGPQLFRFLNKFIPDS